MASTMIQIAIKAIGLLHMGDQPKRLVSHCPTMPKRLNARKSATRNPTSDRSTATNPRRMAVYAENSTIATRITSGHGKLLIFHLNIRHHLHRTCLTKRSSEVHVVGVRGILAQAGAVVKCHYKAVCE